MLFEPSRVVLHHSAGNWGNALFIDALHKGFGWSGGGYHFLVLNGYINAEDYKHRRKWKPLVGSIETLRPLDLDLWIENNEVGAHTLGYNKDSIGVCFIHLDENYEDAMLRSGLRLGRFLIKAFPKIYPATFFGHCELDPVNKPLCPSIDMEWFRKNLRTNSSWFSISRMWRDPFNP